jgi:hypothetical protein
MSSPLMAKICFTVSAIMFMARTGLWLATTNRPLIERIVLSLLIFGVSGFAWAELIRWVDSLQQ